MKKLSALCLVIASAMALVGCSSYASVAATADGKALVAKNGIFGKSVYVCQVTPTGLANCQAADSP
jgi:PBP1b-binding outer membrane lipoprotein LpoB